MTTTTDRTTTGHTTLNGFRPGLIVQHRDGTIGRTVDWYPDEFNDNRITWRVEVEPAVEGWAEDDLTVVGVVEDKPSDAPAWLDCSVIPVGLAEDVQAATAELEDAVRAIRVHLDRARGVLDRVDRIGGLPDDAYEAVKRVTGADRLDAMLQLLAHEMTDGGTLTDKGVSDFVALTGDLFDDLLDGAGEVEGVER